MRQALDGGPAGVCPQIAWPSPRWPANDAQRGEKACDSLKTIFAAKVAVGIKKRVRCWLP